jgi:hypothetical protein
MSLKEVGNISPQDLLQQEGVSNILLSFNLRIGCYWCEKESIFAQKRNDEELKSLLTP